MVETWRVVLRDGSVREASVEPAVAYGYMAPESATCGWRATRVGEGDTVHAAPEAMGGDAADAVTRLAAHNGWPVREILAPGEPTRAEAVAAERERCAQEVRRAESRGYAEAREACAQQCEDKAEAEHARREGLDQHSATIVAGRVAALRQMARAIRAGGV